MYYQTDLFTPDASIPISLIRCSRSHFAYKDIRNRHYVANRGCIGRQFHYLIYVHGEIVGIISGASPVWACKPRDDYFKIQPDNRERLVGHNIINNVVFRLETHIPNLGSQVLALWRRQVKQDWIETHRIYLAI